MGAYREQLLKETYGTGRDNLYRRTESRTEEYGEAGSPFALFKLKFMICLLLFAGFAWMNATGNSFYNISAEQIVEAVTDQNLEEELAALSNVHLESWSTPGDMR